MSIEQTAPYWLLIAAALGAACWFARAASKERAAREVAERQALAQAAELKALTTAASERDAARAEARDLAAKLAASESAAEAREAAAREREQALIAFKLDVEKSFGALAGEALAKSEARFIALANETFEKHQTAAAGGVKEVVTPVQEAFSRLSETVDALNKARLQEASTFSEQIRQVSESLKETQGLTGKLVTALRAAPKTRGRWGEETLRNVLELSGLSAHVDFTEQASVDSEGGKLRPDVIIRLPGNRQIVVDSKVALSAYLDAMDAPDETTREAHLKNHALQLRTHMKQLGGKEYWKHVPDTADFVALFVPGENFFAAAAERDPDLFEDGLALKVIIVTPATLVALAKAVAYGWRQEAAAKNAQEIATLGRELYRRLATMADKIGNLGNSLEKSVKSYNELVGSVEARVLPQARRFKELGAGEEGEIAVIEQSNLMPRLPAPQAELDLDAAKSGKKASKGLGG
ncbi:MAG: DNA recombination protein RmuC [Alphaproteobacteria bacterium]|jgi:DNA recombination protein RmuC|nr:DNA recombination protein RmuC [Alphaproteobacteria bacterium]